MKPNSLTTFVAAVLLAALWTPDASAVDLGFTIGMADGRRDVSRAQHVEILAHFANRSGSETAIIDADWPEEIRSDFVFSITDPSGKQIVLRRRPGIGHADGLSLAPHAEGDVRFDMNRLYKFVELGRYVLTAEYLYRENNGPVIKTFRSNPLSVTVVDPTRIQWGTETQNTQFGICQSETVPQTVLIFLRTTPTTETNRLQGIWTWFASERFHPLSMYFGPMTLLDTNGAAVPAREPRVTNPTNFPLAYSTANASYDAPGEHVFRVEQVEQLVEAVPLAKLFETLTNAGYRFTISPKFYKRDQTNPDRCLRVDAQPMSIPIEAGVAAR